MEGGGIGGTIFRRQDFSDEEWESLQSKLARCRTWAENAKVVHHQMILLGNAMMTACQLPPTSDSRLPLVPSDVPVVCDPQRESISRRVGCSAGLGERASQYCLNVTS